MRDFHKLDMNALKAFYYASETLNFTHAASRAKLTQSGISQHIAHLEKELGLSLFQRFGKNLSLSEAGKKLRIFCESYLDQVDGILEELKVHQSTLKGLVRYAMPSSCLLSPHFGLLLNKRKAFPEIDLQVQIIHSEKVIEAILKSEIDFGFSTQNISHSDLDYYEFVKEEYVLVGHSNKPPIIKSLKVLYDHDFINYPGMSALATAWVKEQITNTKFDFQNIKIRASIDAIEGAMTLVQKGVGLGFFPRHCVESAIRAKKLTEFSGKSKINPLNPIYIVRSKKLQSPARVKRVIDAFIEMKSP